MNPPDKSSELLVKTARDNSVARLRELAGSTDVKIFDFVPVLPVYGHWMSFILLTGDAVRMIFKVHYMTSSARQLAASAYGFAVRDCTKLQAIDFVKEFCNLTAGAVKHQLKSNGLEVSISLPSTTRGFDEIFFQKGRRAETHHWVLDCESSKFICSIDFEIFDPLTLSEPSSQVDNTESGDVDFL